MPFAAVGILVLHAAVGFQLRIWDAYRPKRSASINADWRAYDAQRNEPGAPRFDRIHRVAGDVRFGIFAQIRDNGMGFVGSNYYSQQMDDAKLANVHSLNAVLSGIPEEDFVSNLLLRGVWERDESKRKIEVERCRKAYHYWLANTQRGLDEYSIRYLALRRDIGPERPPFGAWRLVQDGRSWRVWERDASAPQVPASTLHPKGNQIPMNTPQSAPQGQSPSMARAGVVLPQPEAPSDPGHTLDVSLVIPVYNSAETLCKLYQRLSGPAARLGRYEIILVDDGSRDDSWAGIQSLASGDPRVLGMRMGRNFGQHAALLAGIRAARGRVTVTLDDDLQNPPEEIPKLMASLDQGYDVVYGTPEKLTHTAGRNLASWTTKLVLKVVMGAETARHVSAFRAFRTNLRDAFAQYRSPYVNLDVLFTWGTTRFGAVAVGHQPRAQGRSGYNLYRLITHAANMVTGFSAVPLQLVTVMGFTFTLFGLATLVYVLIRYLIAGSVVPGFPYKTLIQYSLSCAVSHITSAQ
jgi:undecaprenyl-phosphate 4-deoxy-4-formamido-L-arabinose transferase